MKIINQSSIFLLPMLGSSNSEFPFLDAVFMNYEDSKLENCICLLMGHINPDDKMKFKTTLKLMYSKPEYYKQIKLDSENYLLIFIVPERYIEDYNCFLKSKPSMLSTHYKNKIVNFHNYRENGNGEAIIKVMKKDESLYLNWEEKINKGLPPSSWITIPRDQEISPLLNEEVEIFGKRYNYSNLIEKNKC